MNRLLGPIIRQIKEVTCSLSDVIFGVVQTAAAATQSVGEHQGGISMAGFAHVPGFAPLSSVPLSISRKHRGSKSL